MTRMAIRAVVRASVKLGLAAAAALLAPAAAAFDASALMDWAERSYPTLFPGHQANQSLPPYVYRYYPQTGNHVGVGNGTVYLLGPVSGGQLLPVGALGSFECQVQPERCTGMLPRIVIDDGVVVVRDSLGRHVAWGQSANLPASAGTPLEGTGTRLLATGARQVSSTFIVRADGKVQVWGSVPWLLGQPRSFANAAELELPGQALQLHVRLASSFTLALLADGSIWRPQGSAEVVGSLARLRLARLNMPVPIRAMSNGLVFGASYAHAMDGSVWEITTSESRSPRKIATLDGAGLFACDSLLGSPCAAVLANGTIITWDPDKDPAEAGSVTVLPSITNVRSVATSVFWLAAITDDGRLWTMPSRFTAISERDIKPVPGFEQASDVACAGAACVALKRDGSVWGWGNAIPGLEGSGSLLVPTRIPGITIR